VSEGFHGTQGSRLITDLIERLQPHWHIAGHYHHMIGPLHLGRTTYVGLALLLQPISRDPSHLIQPGSLALLDTDTADISFVTDGWLTSIGGPGFDFVAAVRAS
jgi:hypothetical protein